MGLLENPTLLQRIYRLLLLVQTRLLG
jgi:hypothetical protein